MFPEVLGWGLSFSVMSRRQPAPPRGTYQMAGEAPSLNAAEFLDTVQLAAEQKGGSGPFHSEVLWGQEIFTRKQAQKEQLTCVVWLRCSGPGLPWTSSWFVVVVVVVDVRLFV